MAQPDSAGKSAGRRYLRAALVVCVAGALLPVALAVCNRLMRSDLGWSFGFIAKFGGLAVVVVGLGLLLWRFLERKQDALDAVWMEQVGFLDALPVPRADVGILVSAALSLFLELAVIRWQATLFPVFAFYKNFSLLACFAGLGLGYAVARHSRMPLVAVVPLLAWQMLVLTFLRYGLSTWHTPATLFNTPVVEQLDMGLSPAGRFLYRVPLYLVLGVTFLLTALAFVPVGQLCGRLMERRPKLRAYGLNLLGSVLGVVLIIITSFLWTPPPVWFAAAFLPLVVFQMHRRGVLLVGLASTIAALVVLCWPVARLAQQIYSPYQLIEVRHGDRGLAVLCAAGHYYQRVHDLSLDSARRKTDEKVRSTANYYEFPYRIHQKPQKVAIVGSGAGNDLAAALRMGAGAVHAIEIDPAILKLGEACHPEKPYADKRVEAIVNDARSFFRTTHEKYDMIVYGLLDSHSLLSHASSVRLDSFVYTVQGLCEARRCLRKGGTLSLSFCVLAPELGRKIYLMMQQAFDGRPPVCVEANYDGAVIFLQREGEPLTVPRGLIEGAGFKDVTDRCADPTLETEVPTDDWPFFYMPRRVYPVSFIPMAVLVLVLTLLMTRLLLHGGRVQGGHVVFFLLGAGFMLVETKAITELGLTFGNTWHVIGIAIVGILFMAFLANAAVAYLGFSRVWLPFLLLFASLAGGYIAARSGGFGATPWGRLAATAVLTCPMLFSGIIFSTLLRSGGDMSSIMAANILGAMCGGLMEYNSMYFGFGFLYLLAIGLYVLALASSVWARPGAAGASG